MKLVIWDLDETILDGVLEEGDKDIRPLALWSLKQLNERGVLQALATQNPRSILEEGIHEFGWSELFVRTEADLGSKAEKVRRIMDEVDIHPSHCVFVDDDPFERDSIQAQVPDVCAWSVSQLADYLKGDKAEVTEEGKLRPRMYIEQEKRRRDEGVAASYDDFLRGCDIRVTIRSAVPEDAGRVRELLSRTHRMNLGVLDLEETMRRFSQLDGRFIVIAEMKDVYGDMGRCGVLHVSQRENGEGFVESLAISCRSQARGVALALLVGMLRYSGARVRRYRCRYIATDRNRPLRMALLAARFKPVPQSDELLLDTDRLNNVSLPEWMNISYQASETVSI